MFEEILARIKEVEINEGNAYCHFQLIPGQKRWIIRLGPAEAEAPPEIAVMLLKAYHLGSQATQKKIRNDLGLK